MTKAPPRPIVLLVQPERDDRDMYVEFLEYVGLPAIAVSTAADALRIAPLVDVVVTGVLLPGPVDGVSLATQLKRSETTRNTPLIALTACASEVERERALAAGCDVFLAKPCNPDVLAQEIRRLLRRRDPRPSLGPRAA
jgi:CheY-like chemotaxis protein